MRYLQFERRTYRKRRSKAIWLCNLAGQGGVMRRDTLLALGVVVLVLAALAAKSFLISVPPVHVAAGQFNASTAKARLTFVLGDQRPHPVDSAADDAVRARLVATLQQMGLEPIVRDQVACNDFQKARLIACARVRNVIAILGPHTGKALLLSAHYDSVPVGPGASDDGIGVATLLEVGSILKERPLKRPIILLFNEGEELGLLGARAFLADPLSRDVDSVLNFDARGVTGPTTMFETSQPNGSAIAALHAVDRPVASSLSTDVYRLIPNYTDVTAYNERGWLTLNFAVMGNETRYHSPGDDLAALDPRSLQHMGDQALAVSTKLASGLPPARSQRIFTDVLGRYLVVMPQWLGMILFAVLALAFAFLLWGRNAYGRPLAASVLAISAGSGGGWLATSVAGALSQGTYWRAHPEVSFIAIYATVLLGAIAGLAVSAPTITRAQLRVAWWFVFLAIGALVAAVAPGAIIYFLAPPIAVLLGISLSKWHRSAEAIGGIVAILLLFITWGEVLNLLEVLFSPGPLWIVAPVAAIMVVPALVEAHALFARADLRLTVIGSAVIALLAWVAVAFTPAYSADRHQRFTIEHLTEFPSGKSSWSILNDGADLPQAYSKLGAWHRGELAFSERQRWLASAPPAPNVQPPAIQLLETVPHGAERLVRIRLKGNGAERILLVAPAKAYIRSVGVPGSIRPIGSGDSAGKFTISCSGRSCDGMELTIDVGTAAPIQFTVVGARNGLPATAAPLVDGRPKLAQPQYTPDETVTDSQVKL